MGTAMRARVDRCTLQKVRVRFVLAPLLAFAAAAVHAQSVPGIPGIGMSFGGFGAMAPGSGPGYIDLDAGLGYIDNARLSSVRRGGDEFALAGLDANYDQQGGMLSARAQGDLDWVQYLHNTNPSGPYGAFAGDAVWGQPSGRLQWFGQDAFIESLANPLAAPTLANLEYVNRFTTGPVMNLHLGTLDRLSVHGVYSNTTYQRSQFGDNSYGAGASLTHSFTAVTNLSLDADASRTQFTKSGIAPTYDMRSASASFRSKTERTSLAATAGYRQVNFSGRYQGTPLYQIDITHELTPYSSVFLNGRSGLANAGGGANASSGMPLSGAMLGDMQFGTSNPAPFNAKIASAGWTYARARTDLSLAASYSRNRYASLPAGYLGVSNVTPYSALTNKMFSVYIRRRIRPSVSLTVRAMRTIREITDVHSSVTEDSYQVAISKQFANARIVFYARRSQQGAVVSRAGLAEGRFTANMVGLMFMYDIVGHRNASTQ